MEKFIDLFTIILALLPLLIKFMGLLSQLTNNKKMHNLTERSQIIVNGLVRSGFANEHKKVLAMSKLAKYASEVGIKVTEDQLDDYIEDAYTLMKVLVDSNKQPPLVETSEVELNVPIEE